VPNLPHTTQLHQALIIKNYTIVNCIPWHWRITHWTRRHLIFYKYFDLMIACIGRNYLSLFKLIKYKIVVFDEVETFNLILIFPSYIYIYIYIYEGKALNNRNFILKCMEQYVQRKILFRDTKWLLSNMSYRGRDDQEVWAYAVGLTTWPLHCQLAPWKSNVALFVFCG